MRESGEAIGKRLRERVKGGSEQIMIREVAAEGMMMQVAGEGEVAHITMIATTIATAIVLLLHDAMASISTDNNNAMEVVAMIIITVRTAGMMAARVIAVIIGQREIIATPLALALDLILARDLDIGEEMERVVRAIIIITINSTTTAVMAMMTTADAQFRPILAFLLATTTIIIIGVVVMIDTIATTAAAITTITTITTTTIIIVVMGMGQIIISTIKISSNSSSSNDIINSNRSILLLRPQSHLHLLSLLIMTR
jgi:hypothetical protein